MNSQFKGPAPGRRVRSMNLSNLQLRSEWNDCCVLDFDVLGDAIGVEFWQIDVHQLPEQASVNFGESVAIATVTHDIEVGAAYFKFGDGNSVDQAPARALLIFDGPALVHVVLDPSDLPNA